ncbi:SEL1-like repeat protein [Streptomyces litchfieldiae]|uniref:Sel1 repeat family protein n=1 Tax=Streptomyces litchfieldiae TaxID=3075543 RepID=A0ABU2MKE2_9ACTN|nr:hypothetical protein [Streptomyces sp. DSM 44938]MDT0342081.1 hypothetical protein [Streptomyces sp. DSM 44938]
MNADELYDAASRMMFPHREPGDVDEAEAERLYRLAAEAGDARALERVGLFAEKRGDLTTAERFYRQASAEGLALADFRIGRLYEDFLGDRNTARQWYKKASRAGEWRATKRLKNMR